MDRRNFCEWILNNNEKILTKLSSKNDVGRHVHDFYEIFYVVSGEITHATDKEKRKLETGDFFFIGKTYGHEFIRGNGVNCSHRDILISEEILREACDFIGENLFDEISKASYISLKIPVAQVVEFERFIVDMETAIVGDSAISRSVKEKILIIQLLNVILHHNEDKNLPGWLRKIIYNFSVLGFVNEGLKGVLQDINYDKSYICREFKKHFNCTMTEYLLRTRLNFAANLLLTTNKTVADICFVVGLSSVPYFVRKFKELYGITPSGFRKIKTGG